MSQTADAAVAILHARAPEESILLMRRAEREGDSWSGHWSFPGGRWEPGDATLVDTALRELEEECGIRLQPSCLERALPLTVARRRTGPFLSVAPFVFRVERALPATVDSREAVEAQWVPLRVLLDPGRHCLRPAPGALPALRYPSVELKGAPLWGFTYRLIAEWLELTRPDAGHQPAAFGVAQRVLDFLLARGLVLQQPWTERAAHVEGDIPVPDVLARFCIPGAEAAHINLLEIQREYVRIVGLAFEEYWIRATPKPSSESPAPGS